MSWHILPATAPLSLAAVLNALAEQQMKSARCLPDLSKQKSSIYFINFTQLLYLQQQGSGTGRDRGAEQGRENTWGSKKVLAHGDKKELKKGEGRIDEDASGG